MNTIFSIQKLHCFQNAQHTSDCCFSNHWWVQTTILKLLRQLKSDTWLEIKRRYRGFFIGSCWYAKSAMISKTFSPRTRVDSVSLPACDLTKCRGHQYLAYPPEKVIQCKYRYAWQRVLQNTSEYSFTWDTHQEKSIEFSSYKKQGMLTNLMKNMDF